MSVTEEQDFSSIRKIHLRLFAAKFDAFSFNHWYIFIIGYIGLIFATFTFVQRIDFSPPTFLENFVPYVTNFTPSFLIKDTTSNWFIWLMLCVIPINALLFNRWRGSINTTFQRLYEQHQLIPNGLHTLDASFTHILTRYQELLSSRRRWFVISLTLLVPFALLIVTLLNGDFYDVRMGGHGGIAYHWMLVPGFETPNVLTYFSAILLNFSIIDQSPGTTCYLFFLAYFVGVASWIIFTTTQIFKKILTTFDVVIIPNHPDKCGGLRYLGSFFFHMNLPFLALAIVLGGFEILELYFHNAFWTIAGIIALGGIVLPVTLYTFFTPLWIIHKAMVVRKHHYETIYTARMANLHETIHTALQTLAFPIAEKAQAELALIHIVYSDDESFPTWPFDRRIFLSVIIPQIISVLGIISGVVSSFMAIHV